MPAIVAFILITLPWLNPFSPGPMAQVTPLLFAWVCAAGVLLMLALDGHDGQRNAMQRAVILAWAAAAGASAVIGLLQYFGLTAGFGVWLNHTEAGQAFGNLRQRNQFASLLNMGLAAAVWLVASGADAGQPGGVNDAPESDHARPPPSGMHLRSVVALSLAAGVSAGNAASASRTGLLQWVLLVVLTLGWLQINPALDRGLRRRVQAVLLVAVVVYALATVFLPLLADSDPLTSSALARLSAGEAGCSSRLTLWRNVVFLIAQKPWLGWGWGELDYAHFITLYPDARFCDILDNAHNLPLQLAVELGLPAALLLCGTARWLIWRGQPWRERQPTRQLAWAVLAVILLHSLLEYPLWYGPFQTAVGLCVWLLWRAPEPAKGTIFYKNSRPLAVYGYTALAIILVAFCGFASWNYFLASQIYLDANQRALAYRENTLEKIKGVWLYQDVVRFAELTITDLEPDNALHLNTLAKQSLHFSPEARVAERVIESARLLGRHDEAAFYVARYRAAFPQDYALWWQKSDRAEPTR